METFVVILLLILAVVFFGAGYWRLKAPLDEIWHQHERAMLARGLSPQRSPAWESNARIHGVPSIVFGIILAFVFFLCLSIPMNTPVKMSKFSINGYEFTQEEYDACHHDPVECTVYYSVHKRNTPK